MKLAIPLLTLILSGCAKEPSIPTEVQVALIAHCQALGKQANIGANVFGPFLKCESK